MVVTTAEPRALAAGPGMAVRIGRRDRLVGWAGLGTADGGFAARGEALALIGAGRDRLRERPNPDADGFRSCEVDRKRDEKYRFLLDEERRRRAAVRDGLKVYDGGR